MAATDISVKLQTLKAELLDVNFKLRNAYLEALNRSTCRVTFTKKDGSTREMYCTRNLDKIDSELHPQKEGDRVDWYNTESFDLKPMLVYDLENSGWRYVNPMTVIEFDESS